MKYDALGRLSRYDDVHEWEQRGEYICPDPFDFTTCYWEKVVHVDTLRTDVFTYDQVGNRTDKGAVLETGKRLTSFNGYTLQYDADGNLTRKVKAGVIDQTLTWNSRGQLVQIVTDGITTTFGYDGFGRRIRKTHNGVTTRYLWDGDDLLAELDGAGNPIREYAYYPGIDQPHSVRRASDGAVFYYMSELPGHVTGLVDPTNQVVNNYEYTPWGEPITTTEQVVQPLRYAAREYDAETKLYYVRARYYDPVLGRFISEDPIGLLGGLNPFAFTENDPINRRDPLGLEACPSGYELVVVIDLEAETVEFRCEQKGGGGGGYSLGTFGAIPLDPVTVTGEAPDPFEFLNNFTEEMMARTDALLQQLLRPSMTLCTVAACPVFGHPDYVREATEQAIIEAGRALLLPRGECDPRAQAYENVVEELLVAGVMGAKWGAKGGAAGFAIGVGAGVLVCAGKHLLL